MLSVARTILLSTMLPGAVMGSSFLGKPGEMTDLLSELENLIGRDHRLATESRVERLEQAVRPMFVAMPKDANGKVDATSVRYLLHRLFVQRHGWFVLGLDNAGEAWNSSSPVDVFQKHAAEHHGLFQEKLSQQGFSLHQIGVFAAALESLIHGENFHRLEAAYRVLGLSKSEILSEEDAVAAIRGYMLIYNYMPQSVELSALTPRQYKLIDSQAGALYSMWSETQKFAQGIRQRILDDVTDGDRTTWATNLRIVEEIAERHGRWQDQDCHDVKGRLIDLEMPGTGRVRLEDFYGGKLGDKSWQFVESVPYLRQLGALDESDPNQMSVVITNYLTSPANCVSSSKFYSVCCIDQCENLLAVIEKQTAAPYASPAAILELIGALPSDTVQAPRALPSSLTRRLEEIAAHHGGQIPLHGRLFAQWMHHAYPHECPFPHMSSTTNPMTQEKWFQSEHGHLPVDIGEDEIRKLLEESKLNEKSSDVEEWAFPWHAEEELFVSSPTLPVAESRTTGVFSQGLMLMAVPFALVFMMLRYGSASGSKKSSLASYTSNHKYYV